MNLIILVFYLIVLLSSKLNSLKPLRVTDFCVINDHRCFIDCHSKSYKYEAKCEGEYSNQCNKQYCSIDSESCKIFANVSSFLNAVKSSQSYQRQLIKLEKFRINIKKCGLNSIAIKIATKGCILNENFNHITHIIRVPNCSCNANDADKCARRLCETHRSNCATTSMLVQISSSSVKLKAHIFSLVIVFNFFKFNTI